MSAEAGDGPHASRHERRDVRSPRRAAVRIALVYALVAAAWVLLGDLLIGSLLSESHQLAMAQPVKDWAFVIVTVLALYVVVRRDLAREPRQESALIALNRFRAGVIDDAAIWINALDTEGRVTLWNKAAEEISGYARAEVMGAVAIWEWLYPDSTCRASIRAEVDAVVSDRREIKGLETEIRCKSGETKVIAWNLRPRINAQGMITGSITIGSDVTERRRAELALLERERQLATLMANLPGMAYRCPANDPWHMTFVSSGCLALTGYPPEELSGGGLYYGMLIHPDDIDRLTTEIGRAVADQVPFEFEYRILRNDGQTRWVWEQGCVVSVDDVPSLEGIVIDISERKRMESELAVLAMRDALTGLYNRREFLQHFGEEVLRAHRYTRPMSLLLIDVDHFKKVNDGHGHQVGDEVLRRIGGVLQSEIRKVDYAARYGGEEFVVVLPEMAAQAALDSAERLRGVLASAPMEGSEGEPFNITVSVGVAVFPDDGDTPDAMFKAADRAMYAAKRGGRNRVCRAG